MCVDQPSPVSGPSGVVWVHGELTLLTTVPTLLTRVTSVSILALAGVGTSAILVLPTTTLTEGQTAVMIYPSLVA